jgi:hypothetical protein
MRGRPASPTKSCTSQRTSATRSSATFDTGRRVCSKGRKRCSIRNNTEWLRWLHGSEASKTISIVRSELENSQAPVWVECVQGAGRYLVSTLVCENLSDAHVDLYRKMLTNLGLKLDSKREITVPAFKGQALVSALAWAASAPTASRRPSKRPSSTRRRPAPGGNQNAGLPWARSPTPATASFCTNSKQDGPKEIYAVYFSYWVHCPIDLSDLLNSGTRPAEGQPALLCIRPLQTLSERGPAPAGGSTDADYRTRAPIRIFRSRRDGTIFWSKWRAIRIRTPIRAPSPSVCSARTGRSRNSSRPPCKVRRQRGTNKMIFASNDTNSRLTETVRPTCFARVNYLIRRR